MGDQILGFAKLLLRHPEKSVKPAVANSYISAIGKKTLGGKGDVICVILVECMCRVTDVLFRSLIQ